MSLTVTVRAGRIGGLAGPVGLVGWVGLVGSVGGPVGLPLALQCASLRMSWMSCTSLGVSVGAAVDIAVDKPVEEFSSRGITACGVWMMCG
jgi:hypothetical protein